MSRLVHPPPCKLVVGLLAAAMDRFRPVLTRLEQEFGRAEYISRIYPFSLTGYYLDEMGPDLIRRWAAFENLVEPNRLTDLKLTTDRLEDEFRDGRGNRRINLDPGLLSEFSLVLATGKRAMHRVYLDRGVWAEPTLMYAHGGYQAWEWTYPDYRRPAALALMNRWRRRYLDQLKDRA